MAAERWIFTRSQLENTPSRRCGIDSDKELNYRQHTANFIQEMGQKLQVSQLTINTAIVFMHRFYMFHSFQRFTRNNIGTACLFLAAKVEEQPRKLEHLIRMAHQCQNPGTPPLDVKSESYLEMAQELVVNENILLQTLGFNLHVDHPHSYVVKTTQMVRASKDLAQASYFLATNSLHLTTMCLQQPSAHVACVCIHIACKWSDLEIPRSSEGKEWFQYTDKDMTFELLEELTTEFLAVLDKCPSKLKKKILTWKKDAGSASQEVDGPPAKKVKHEVSAAAGSAAQAGSQRPHDSQRVKIEHRGEHHDMKQRPPGYNAHSNPSRHDPSRVKLESGHHGSRPDHHIKREPGVDHHIKREPGYHEKREPGYHDQAKRDPNLHHVKMENPASRHPHALALQDAGMRRIKTEPSLSLTPKEYMERREKEKALQAMHQRSHRPGEQHRPTDPFKAPGSSDRHHLDPVARMKERSSHHGAPPGSEQHRKEQHRQRPMPQKSGSEHKSKLTSPPPNSVKAQSNMSDMLEREIQRQQQHLHKSHGSSTQPAAQVSDSFRSQHEQKQRAPTKERDGIFSSIELQKSTVTKPVGSENKRPSGEKPVGEVQKNTRSHDLPPLNISPAKNRARTSSSSSDISPTVAKMRKDDRRLSQDPIVHIKPLPSEIDVKSPTKPVAPDIMAFCEQAAAGSVSPVPQPSPAKPGSQSIKMKLGLKTPTKSEKTNNNNGEVSGENVSERGHRMKDEKSVQKDFIESREHNASSSLKKEKSFERHERKSKDHKAAEKAERSDLKLKISLGGHGNSPNVKAVKNEDAKKHASSPTSLTTSDGLKLKIKLNSSEQSSASGSHGSEKERHETKSQSQEQKPLKVVLKLPSGISSTPPPVEEKERHQHHHRHHKKHKHKDRHKEDRHSRKRAHSPGDGSHHSTSHHSSSSHHPPSSKVPRSDAAHYNNMNTHGNGRHPEGGGSNRNSPALLQVQETLGLLNSVMKQKSMDLKRNMERERHLANAPPLHPGDPYYPTPPPPPPSDVPPLPPGPPPQ